MMICKALFRVRPLTATYLLMRLLILISLRNIQPQSIRIKIQLVLPTRLLQDLRNIPRVLDPPQINI